MKKQALSTLSIQPLKLYRQTLNRRIDGRQNIRLAEQYRIVRDQAQKIKQGKGNKLGKAQNFHKNIYLKKDSQYKHNSLQPGLSSSSSVNRNSFNFNDIYKVSKNKLGGWLVGNKKEQKPQQISQNVNQNQHHQHNNLNQQHLQNRHLNQQAIFADFPPAMIIEQDRAIQKDPYQQQIPDIIGQELKIKGNSYQQQFQKIIIQGVKHESKQGDPKGQPKVYERLFDQDQYKRHVKQEQQRVAARQQIYQWRPNVPQVHPQGPMKNPTKVPQQRKNPASKNFEFDDLPGMGWKKLKGWIGWGSKNKQSKNQPVNNKNQSIPNKQQGYTPQQFQYMPEKCQGLPHQQSNERRYIPQQQQFTIEHSNQSQVTPQRQPALYNPKKHEDQHYMMMQPYQISQHQRKRAPIFSTYQGKSLKQDLSLKEQKMQKPQYQPLRYLLQKQDHHHQNQEYYHQNQEDYIQQHENQHIQQISQVKQFTQNEQKEQQKPQNQHLPPNQNNEQQTYVKQQTQNNQPIQQDQQQQTNQKQHNQNELQNTQKPQDIEQEDKI